MDLSGRTILITGASSGIGREAAIHISRLGARLVLVARDQERLEATAQQLQAPDEGEHHIAAFDLTAIDELPKWLKALTARVGPLDGLAHCAGVALVKPLRFLTAQDMQRINLINVDSAIGLAKAYRQKNCYREHGSIVFLSSVAALRGLPAKAAYAGSKGALISITKSLAIELAPQKIRVNCIAPAVVETEMWSRARDELTTEQIDALEGAHPIGFGKPTDVANAIAFMLADSGRWITGVTLPLDGGCAAA